jgi:hypothetical protein
VVFFSSTPSQVSGFVLTNPDLNKTLHAAAKTQQESSP